MTTGAIVVAGGRGERLGRGVPKGMIEINGLPMWMFASLAFESANSITTMVVVVPGGYEEVVIDLAKHYGLSKIKSVVVGGDERQDSVALGLNALPATAECLLIHDGARPFVSIDLIDLVSASLRTHKAAFAGLPISDTLHQNKGGMALEGPDRSLLVGAQTPQGFHRTVLEEAMKLAGKGHAKYTDEVALVRNMLHINSAIVPGDPSNIKVTRPEDLILYSDRLKGISDKLKSRLS